MIFLSIVLLLNTSDGLACLESTLQGSTQIGGVLPIDVALPYFLAQPSDQKHVNALDVLLKLVIDNGGTILSAPNSACIDNARCSSYYLMQKFTPGAYTDVLAYNVTKNNMCRIPSAPIWHTVVEPYDSSMLQEQDLSCRRYGPGPIQLNICIADVFDSDRNESVAVVGKYH
jgi:hypothetical protein